MDVDSALRWAALSRWRQQHYEVLFSWLLINRSLGEAEVRREGLEGGDGPQGLKASQQAASGPRNLVWVPSLQKGSRPQRFRIGMGPHPEAPGAV